VQNSTVTIVANTLSSFQMAASHVQPTQGTMNTANASTPWQGGRTRTARTWLCLKWPHLLPPCRQTFIELCAQARSYLYESAEAQTVVAQALGISLATVKASTMPAGGALGYFASIAIKGKTERPKSNRLSVSARHQTSRPFWKPGGKICVGLWQEPLNRGAMQPPRGDLGFRILSLPKAKAMRLR